MSDTPSQGTSVCPENWSKSNRLMRRLLLLWAGGIGTELIVFFIGPPIVLHFVPWEVWRESVAIWWLGGIGILTVIWFGACLGGICLGARMKTHVRETLRNQDRTAIGCWVDVLPSLTSYMW